MGGGLSDSQQQDTSQQQNQSKSYAEKVDLNDLDWEDRERVLRLLFSKMNAGVAPNVSQMQASNGGDPKAKNSDIPALEYE